MRIDEREIKKIIEEVLRNIEIGKKTSFSPSDSSPYGIFSGMDEAIKAAGTSHAALMSCTLEQRRKMIRAVREIVPKEARRLAEAAVEETGFGRVEDKIKKNILASAMTPGIEDLVPQSYTDDHGLTLVEHAPYGVIGAITPSTNPTETIICNAIGMIAGGNSVVFAPHPGARLVSHLTVSLLNRAMVEAGGPENIITTISNPSIEEAQYMMDHPAIDLLVVTGGPGVVREAMKRQKKVIAAGPGNPPVVVDETADITKAARDIVAGAGFDNNIICICEKEIIVEKTVANGLAVEMKRFGGFQLTPEQTEKLTGQVITDPGTRGHEGAPNKEYVGRDAAVIARKTIGITVPENTKILFAEVDADHPLVWTEQLMPVIPMVRMNNVDEAIDFAVECEHGFRHTASMHSKNIEKLSRMAKVMNCSLFVKNGSNFNGMAAGGAGFTSFTIASPTGEGFTRARTFTRERRCSLIDYFRIV